MSVSFEELRNKIREIWYWLELSDEELIPLQVPALNKTRWLIYYGNFGGPASKNSGSPIDCLDLMCKFHDASFNTGNASDIALKESCDYLKSVGMIKSDSAKVYSERINTIWFSVGCWMWRWITVYSAIFVGILASCCATAILLFF